MKIKDIQLKNNLILGPMAGVTTYAFRSLCEEQNAGFTCAEMISDKALIYQNQKTYDMLDTKKGEMVAAQIFGASYDTITEGAKIMLEKEEFPVLDVNMGCPVNKVIKSGSGSFLMKDPSKIYDIVKSLVDNIDRPITCKIRLGWDHQSINCIEVGKLIEKAGASAIALHARTRSDFYQNTPKYEYIKKLKETLSIPVVASGDIKDIESAVYVQDYTNADGLMIARAALGNPFIFRELSEYFENGKIIEKPTPSEILDTMKKHAERLVALKGEHVGMVEMRTHGAWYLRHIPGTKQFRVEMSTVSTFEQFLLIMEKVKQIIE